MVPVERFSACLVVQDSTGNDLYRKDFLDQEQAAQESTEFAETYGHSLQASRFCMVSIRTDRFTHFAADFFCPSTIRALTLHNIGLKILAFLGAVIFDLLTLPIRLIALPFICFSSASSHPILALLDETPKDEKLALIIERKQTDLEQEEGRVLARESVSKLF
jgi:hypothetical protein